MLCAFIEIAAVVWLFIHCCVSDLSVEITKEEKKYYGASNLHNFLKCSLEMEKHCFFPIEINKYNTQSVNISAAAVSKNIDYTRVGTSQKSLRWDIYLVFTVSFCETY